MASETQLRLAVVELTELLRSDESLQHLRSALAAKGLSASSAFLAGLIEGEDESAVGVILVPEGDCFRFETSPSGSLTAWEVVHDLKGLSADFEAVEVGIAMLKADNTL